MRENNRYTRLIFVFTAVSMLVCRRGDPLQSQSNYTQTTIVFSDSTKMSCEKYLAPTGVAEDGETILIGDEYKCGYICPDGNSRQIIFHNGDFSQLGTYRANWDAKYCTVTSVTEPPSTEAPAVEIPTTTEPPVSVPLLLTGEITMCDRTANLVNFRLFNDIDKNILDNMQIELGGEPVTCSVNKGNSTLLTCSLPPLMVFPTKVRGIINGTEVNSFDFDGTDCVSDSGQLQDDSGEDLPAP